MGRTNHCFAGLVMLALLTACSAHYPNREVVGERFPNVNGETLTEERVDLPQHFSGEATILLLGYVQNSQFDIDRWLIGLDMTDTKAPVYELPTIAGMFPKFFETQINNGMRKGIPKELWKGVITIFEGGETVQAFTGNTNPNNARAMVINASGEVVFFHDRGFSVEALKQLKERLLTVSAKNDSK